MLNDSLAVHLHDSLDVNRPLQQVASVKNKSSGKLSLELEGKVKGFSDVLINWKNHYVCPKLGTSLLFCLFVAEYVIAGLHTERQSRAVWEVKRNIAIDLSSRLPFIMVFDGFCLATAAKSIKRGVQQSPTEVIVAAPLCDKVRSLGFLESLAKGIWYWEGARAIVIHAMCL